jgi:hypothetical protein
LSKPEGRAANNFVIAARELTPAFSIHRTAGYGHLYPLSASICGAGCHMSLTAPLPLEIVSSNGYAHHRFRPVDLKMGTLRFADPTS